MTLTSKSEYQKAASDCAVRGSVTDHRLAVLTSPTDREAGIRVLEEILGFNAIDARVRLHHTPAVWPEAFDSETAERGAQFLCDLGAPARSVHVDDVHDLRQSRTLHHVRCEPQGFTIVSISGQPEETIPWNRLAALSVADVADLREGAPSPILDGVFRRAVGGSSLEPHHGVHGLEMWLLCEAPFRAFRIDAELMNYEYLGEQLSSSAGENFARLVRDICRQAPYLKLTSWAAAYLNNSFQGLHQMPSPDAHREAVAAYWVLHSRDTTAPQVHVDPAGVAGSPAAVHDLLAETRHQLHEKIRDLRAHCRDRCIEGSAQSESTSAKLRALKEILVEHFEAEDAEGDMRPAPQNDRHLDDQAQSLRQQHDRLEQELDGLLLRSSLLNTAIVEFLQRLEGYEHAENTL